MDIDRWDEKWVYDISLLNMHLGLAFLVEIYSWRFQGQGIKIAGAHADIESRQGIGVLSSN